MPTLGGVILVDPVSGEPYKAATTAEVASQMADPNSELGAALSSTYVTFERSDTGAPITGGHIVVKVDPATHEITDIIWEA